MFVFSCMREIQELCIMIMAWEVNSSITGRLLNGTIVSGDERGGLGCLHKEVHMVVVEVLLLGTKECSSQSFW